MAGVTVKATKPAFTSSGSSTPTGSSSGSSGSGASGASGASGTPKASNTRTSAGVASFDPKAMRLGLVAAAVGAASFLFFYETRWYRPLDVRFHADRYVEQILLFPTKPASFLFVLYNQIITMVTGTET